MTYIDNPAQTLHNFLSEIKESSRTNNTSLKRAIALQFNLDEKNVHLIWETVSKLMTLPQKVENIITDYFLDLNIQAPTWMKNVTEIFEKTSLNASVGEFISPLQSQTLIELGLISNIFKMKGQIGEIPSSDLDDLRDDFYEIKESIINSDFSPKLKSEIMHYINTIIRALDDYKITGIEPVISSVEATMGHTVISEEFQRVVTDTNIGQKIKSTLLKSLSVISAVDGVTSIASNAMSLLEHFNK
ncbi:hypothetical protein DMW53_13325 [Serratia marcescens]|uniref:hypothetical protein n=1 Tax=Serratia marcescens TaxID=615 RepID=UPI000D8A9EA5|nr:hypothetical protein [Serratia marcescens]PYA59595.1 hypothetical protein DMW53_13325 [Serratia marcescens]PYB18001.1 hypothetical protein DMW55_12040 [Serratia marcescens]